MDISTMIQEYIYEYYTYIDDSAAYLDRAWFRQRCYELWAAKEIGTLLEECSTYQEASDKLTDYLNMADNFACKDKDDTLMFSAAYDVGMDIMDYMISVIEKYEKGGYDGFNQDEELFW